MQKASEHGHEGVLEFLSARREAVHGLIDVATAEDDAGALDAGLEDMLAPGLGVLAGALVDAFVDTTRPSASRSWWPRDARRFLLSSRLRPYSRRDLQYTTRSSMRRYSFICFVPW